MNYRHIYHAGNIGDVFKHAVLIALLQKLIEKPKPLAYIDTHSGIGRYDLSCDEASRSPEYLEGADKLLKAVNPLPELSTYINIIKEMQTRDALHEYPGSPWIASLVLREIDSLILNEKHPEDFLTLKRCFKRDRRIHVHQRDAYELLPAILPPNPKRALILMDPAYEDPKEYHHMLSALEKSLTRFPSGIYAIWYPLIDGSHHLFIKKLRQKLSQPILQAELQLKEDGFESGGLLGSGMLIINPPWQIEPSITKIAKYLCAALKQYDKASYRLTI